MKKTFRYGIVALGIIAVGGFAFYAHLSSRIKEITTSISGRTLGAAAGGAGPCSTSYTWPTIKTLSPSAITQTGATFSFTFTNSSYLDYSLHTYFQYGDGIGAFTSVSTAATVTPVRILTAKSGTVAEKVNNLLPDTQYYYPRVDESLWDNAYPTYKSNCGTSNKGLAYFNTLKPAIPSTVPTTIGRKNASILAAYTTGFDSLVINYGTSPKILTSTSTTYMPIGITHTPGNANIPLSGLTPATKYYYQVVGRYTKGTLSTKPYAAKTGNYAKSTVVTNAPVASFTTLP